jgi:hypothetical protein
MVILVRFSGCVLPQFFLAGLGFINVTDTN